MRAARAARLFSLARPIKFLFCGVVVAVPVIDVKAFYFPFSGVSGATLRSEIVGPRDSVEVGRTLHICSSAIKT